MTTLSNLNIGDTYYVQSDGSVHSVSIPYDLANAVFVDSFSISSQQTEPGGVAFSTTGDKMFVIGDTPNNFVSEYALSTSFDVSTASFTHNSMTINSQEAQAQDLAFNTDGTKMFVVGSNDDEVNEYALSTGFNVSTASFTRLFSLASQELFPTGLAFNTNGTKMFIVGTTGDDVNEYALTTGFNISTASFTDSFSVASQDETPTSITFNADGTKMFITGGIGAGAEVIEYNLSTGFDVSTSSYLTSFQVGVQESQPHGIAFSSDGKKMFIIGRQGNDVNEYTTSPASTSPAVNIGKAISTTSLILKG